jgi:hypothetical protein
LITQSYIQFCDFFSFSKKSRKAQKLYKALCPPLSNIEFQIALGLALGDISFQTLSNNECKNKIYRIRFEQGDINKDYLFHLYEIFEFWTFSPPKKYIRINKLGNSVITWRFQTFNHTSFSTLTDLFINSNGKKIVPDNLIITPCTLAYWFMDDGGKLDYRKKNPSKALILNTQGFTKLEVIRLNNILKTTYDFDSWIKSNKKGWIIVIASKNFLLFKNYMKNYVIHSMAYKLFL